MKCGRKLLAAVVVAAALVGSAAAAGSTGNLTPQGARAYLAKIAELQGEYGSTTFVGERELYTGLSMAKLVDFDGDGTPELYCAAYLDGQWLYTWENGELHQLDIPEKLSNNDFEETPITRFYIGDDKAYLDDGHVEWVRRDDGRMESHEVNTYLTKQGDKMTPVFTTTDKFVFYEDHICTLDGKEITYDDLQKALGNRLRGMEELLYNSWAYVDHYRNIKGVLSGTVADLLTLTTAEATISTDAIRVDGKDATIRAYKISGNNYYKLRDVAVALNGTEKQFSVLWNAAKNRVDLAAGQGYTPDGSENKVPTAGSPAALSANHVYIDGNEASLTVYKIAGSNYFKLRDLGAAMDFGIDWNGDTQTISIDTAAPYRAE